MYWLIRDVKRVDIVCIGCYEMLNVWALYVLAVARYNSAEKWPIEAGSNQQSSELQPSMLSINYVGIGALTL